MANLGKILKDQALIVLDVPNKNNRTYTTEVCKDAIERIGSRNIMGTVGFCEGYHIPMERYTHEAKNVRIENGEVLADIHLLSNDHTNALARMLAIVGENNIAFRTAGIVKMNGDGVVTHFDLHYIAALNPDTAA